MKYQIKILSKARRSIKKLPKSVQENIKIAVRNLAENPRPNNVKKLSGSDNLYRLRLGDYRIIYQIKDYILLIVIVMAGHRREIYRNY